ncbi:unnamed protein product [Orchesella dallaii]|uniref:UBX domain-containing protein n=1 Tax=Orchesella dallaii TaxID=48710 RepID=A0ABP1Q7Z4_9HEXA
MKVMGNGSSNDANSTPSPNRPMTRSWRRLTGQPLEQDEAQPNKGDDSSRKRPTEAGAGDGPKVKEGRYDEKNDQDIIFSDDESDTEPATPKRNLNETPSTTRALVAEQNKAYNDSLRADQEKEMAKQAKLKEEQAVKDAEENIIRLKKEAKENLPSERSNDEEGVFPLVLRLPSGKSIRRNFRATDTLHTLRQFAFSQEETPVNFEIVKYPNKVLPAGENEDGSSVLLLDVGITTKEVVNVRTEVPVDSKALEENKAQDESKAQEASKAQVGSKTKDTK